MRKKRTESLPFVVALARATPLDEPEDDAQERPPATLFPPTSADEETVGSTGTRQIHRRRTKQLDEISAETRLSAT